MSGTCAYTADAEDFEEWGGDPDKWSDFLNEELDIEGETWECPHEALDGRECCPFHTETEELPEDLNESEELLAAIEASTGDEPDAHRLREFVGATFGDIDLGETEISGHDDYPLFFLGASFDGRFEFHGECEFDSAILLTVVGELDFERAIIKGEAAFWGAIIEDVADFRDATFEHVVILQSAIIKSGAYSKRATIKQVANFRDTTIEGKANFRDTTIEGKANFRDTTIEGEANFRDTTIEGEADFRDAVINGEANFWGATIEGEAKFQGATIEGGASFHGATIGTAAVEDESDTEDTTAEETYFSQATFGDDIDFRGATIATESVILFEETIVRGDADFSPRLTDETKFVGLTSFAAIEIQGSADFSGQVLVDDIVRTQFEDPPSFADAELSDADFAHADLSDATLSHADLTDADFSDATLTDADLEKADLTDADIGRADLTHANLERAVLSRADLFDADLSGTRLEGAVLGDVQINEGTFGNLEPEETPEDSLGTRIKRFIAGPTGTDAYRCVYDPKSRYDQPPREKDDDDPPEIRAGGVYRQFERLAANNAMPDWQQEFFTLRQDMETRRLGRDDEEPRPKYWFALVQRALFGYGESFGRIIGWSGLLVVLFAVVHLLGGWVHPVNPDDTLGPAVSWTRLPEHLQVLWQSLYYSTLTFTALGFGDFRPVGGLGQFVTVVETSTGAVLLALLVFVFGRRAAR